jgi:hypothetical protein
MNSALSSETYPGTQGPAIRSTSSFDYYVPEDPMDALQCDSCQ